MKIGLVATDAGAAAHLLGLMRACVDRGWECRCFLTDSGTRLLQQGALLAMVRDGSVRVDVCEHAWSSLGLGPAPDGIKLRSQFQNAELARDCDRVVVF